MVSSELFSACTRCSRQLNTEDAATSRLQLLTRHAQHHDASIHSPESLAFLATMVRLTMTLPIVEGLKKRRDAAACDPSDASEPPPPDASDSNPSLVDPEVGKPITHKQIIDLWQSLRTSGDRTSSLESLLQGSRVYIPPPPPKPEPVCGRPRFRQLTSTQAS